MARTNVVAAAWLMIFLSTAVDIGAREPLRIRCTWSPPEIGSIPVRYYLQIQDTGAESTLDSTYLVDHIGGDARIEQEFFFLDGNYFPYKYRARVRAEDALGRIGPWSAWNEPTSFDEPEPEF